MFKFIKDSGAVEGDREMLRKLLTENGLFEEVKGLKSNFESGQVERFRFHGANRAFETYYLFFSVGARGDRSVSITFDESGRLLLYTNDTNKWFDGGLSDLNKDGCVDKMVSYTIETGGFGKGAVYDVVKFFSFVEGKAILLLEINYNTNAAPGDEKYLALGWQDNEIYLKGSNDGVVRFIWSVNNKSFIQVQVGEMTNNWELIKTVPLQSMPLQE